MTMTTTVTAPPTVALPSWSGPEATPTAAAGCATMGSVVVWGDGPSDEDLVAAARGGDARAFAALVRRHDPSMRRLASTLLRRPSAVDDVLQDAYLAAYRGLAGFRGEARFSTWLYRIVYRTAIDHQRRFRPTAVLDELDERLLGGGSAGGDDESDRLDTADAVRRALQAVSAEHRAVLTLVDAEGYRYHEVAAILGIREGTVASRLARARAALRRHLDLDDDLDAELAHDRTEGAR